MTQENLEKMLNEMIPSELRDLKEKIENRLFKKYREERINRLKFEIENLEKRTKDDVKCGNCLCFFKKGEHDEDMCQYLNR